MIPRCPRAGKTQSRPASARGAEPGPEPNASGWRGRTTRACLRRRKLAAHASTAARRMQRAHHMRWRAACARAHMRMRLPSACTNARSLTLTLGRLSGLARSARSRRPPPASLAARPHARTPALMCRHACTHALPPPLPPPPPPPHHHHHHHHHQSHACPTRARMRTHSPHTGRHGYTPIRMAVF